MVKREYFKFDFNGVVKFDCKCGRRYINTSKCVQNTTSCEPQTNADRIRAMSDEELAIVLMCPNENGLADIECNKDDNCNCFECIRNWLQREVEE